MIDGAMGTEIQTYKLTDADYRGTFTILTMDGFWPWHTRPILLAPTRSKWNLLFLS